MVQVLAGSTLFQRISKKSTAVRWGAKAVSPCVIAVMGIGGECRNDTPLHDACKQHGKRA